MPQGEGSTTPGLRILVADTLAKEGLEFLNGSGIAFEVKTPITEDELTAAVKEFDALIVRSAAKVTAKVLENPGRLKVIARAGVGVDNIHLPTATAKGVLVLNTAEASTLSTAEHALALMMSLARKIPAAHAHVSSGPAKWNKTHYQGTQLAGKTLGVVGLGRIGRTVASRAIAMEMTVVGFDPYFTAETALDGKVRIVRDFDEFLSQVDVITFHVPGGEGTKHLLNRDRLFNKCRPNLLVVNDARGEVVDEFALADALREKKIAGAALDVFIKEPTPPDHPLLKLENAVLTPHLGASTDEAQTAVSVEACKSIVAYLTKGEIRGAVNAGGIKLDLPPDELPFTKLASRAGGLLAGLMDGGYKRITLRASGPRAPRHMNTLLRLAAVELLKPHLGEGAVNVINVEHLARSRGIELVAIHEEAPPAGLVGDVVGLRAEGPGGDVSGGGETHRILGTVYADGLPRVLRIDDYAMDMIPEGNMVVVQNEDQPGVIGFVGTSFGDARVNIADMVISRAYDKSGKATALMVIKTDSAPDAKLLGGLRARPGILKVKSVALPPRDA
ncbi:MAG: D-3-phosphoglycerate dehydrogenase [uncultured Phycisphaerae bacterium]|uniref:D-3-phosphoglycerate dehydrogenase n=1 Tax=uncultured Phycisphaerae bacterium TaxID=904963 RepID=A0A6J4NUW3_9BACT|nr:MAG: D-3-phosphoglycerate dehydrogenase [uncultured Phycisphaerae bacterium]